MSKTNLFDAGRAPELLINDVAPSWSGKFATNISDDEVRALCDFADAAGWECGNADAAYGISLQNERNPFAASFLGGTPHLLWAMSYRRGMRTGTRNTRHFHVAPHLNISALALA
jgi:hypothetical protein